jgi:hypothetical protein
MMIKNTGFTVKIKTHGLAAKLAHVPVKHEDVTEKKMLSASQMGRSLKKSEVVFLQNVFLQNPNAWTMKYMKLMRRKHLHQIIPEFAEALARTGKGSTEMPRPEKCCIDG